MKSEIFIKPIILGAFCIFTFYQSEINAGVDTSGAYPYALFSNNFPSAGERITVEWLLGINKNDCVPRYETSVTQTVSNRVINLYLNYKELKGTQEKICLPVLTSYGPQFAIGLLKADYTYKVYIDSSLVREFYVAPKKFPYPIINPPEPHVGDNVSVQWVLGEDSSNCIMQYAEKIINTTLMKSNPPIHTVHVDYQETPVDYHACLRSPTLYGPTFILGVVEAGDYLIYFDTAMVAHFSVNSVENIDLLTVEPEQPVEGDTLKVKLVLGNGSSSCAPHFITKYDMESRGDGAYEYSLTYETVDNTSTVCTKDYVPFGPEWIFTDLKAGTTIFRYSNDNYYKVFIQKKRQIPDSPYVTVKGTVFDLSSADKTLEGDILAIAVPQCTVMVVFENVVIAKKPQRYIDSIVNGNDTAAGIAASTVSTLDMFMAVTDKNGEYTMSNVPSSVLLNRSYTVAVKKGLVGYGTIPDVLSKEITSNISLFKLEAFVDSVKVVFGGSENVVSLLKQLGIECSSGVKKTGVGTCAKAMIIPVAGGFELANPDRQKISVAAYTIDGKKIWIQNAGILTEGKYFFAMPRVSTGIFLIVIRGEKFEQTKVITIK